MSLLDDVSIVVTPNGYKAGELYAVVPTNALGSEQVTNGDYTEAGVGNVISQSGGLLVNDSNRLKITSDGSSGFSRGVWETNGSQGERFIIKADIISTSGTVRFIDISNNAGTSLVSGTTFEIEITLGSSGKQVGFGGLSDTSFEIILDNVSVKEITGADMDVTRATAGTRVDENGLVNYAEIIGGEEAPSIASIVNVGGGTITQISGNSYSSTSDGTSGSGIRPKFDFNTTAGKRYKLTITPTGTISGTINFKFYDGSSYLFQNYDFTTTKEIYFIDNGSVFGAFDGTQTYSVASFTVSVKEVTRDNVPRIDYTGGGCPHILAEPQRTNLLTYSEDFSNASWQNSSVGTTPVLTSGFTSPDGTNNAYKISNSNQNSFWYWNSSSIGASDARSIYARTVSGTGTAQLLSHNTNTNNTFNLTEEWQRFEVSTTTSGIGNTSYYAVDFRGGGTLDELLIWGAQAEVGSYPTSYIPTSGSTVTRNQDIFTRDGIGSLINSTEGVLFLEMAALADDGTNRYISISSSTTPSDDYIYFRFMSTSNRVLCRTRVGGSTINTIEKTITDTTDYNKYAIKWKSGDYAFWINGVEVGTDTNSTIFGADVLNQIRFDFPVGSGTFPSKVKQLQVYNTALTDEQLLQLTGTSGTDFYESYAEMASALTYTIQ